MALSKEWITFVATLPLASKNILRSTFQTLITQLTTLKLSLTIQSIRQLATMEVQSIIVSTAQSVLNTAKNSVTPVTNIFNSLKKGSTSQGIPIPTNIPEIFNNTQSLYSIIQKPTVILEEAKNKLNKLTLYASSITSQISNLDAQINQLNDQILSLV